MRRSTISHPSRRTLAAVKSSSRSVRTRAVTKELLQDAKSMVRELKGLEWQETELREYFARSVKPIKGFEDVSSEKLANAVDVIREKFSAEDLKVEDRDVQAMLTEMRNLWRWKRRGGGVGWEEEGLPLSTIALYELQNVPLPDEEDDELAARRAEIEASSKEDRVTSVLLDNLNLTDAEKAELGAGVQQVAGGFVQTALWNAIGLMVIFLAGINFLMMKGGN